MKPIKSGKFILFIVICLFVLLCFTDQVHALMFEMTEEELEEGADDIIVGNVQRTSSYWNADRTGIFTEVSIEVKEYLSDSGRGNTKTVIVEGGKVGDLEQWVSDEPIFEEGETAKLYLKEMEASELSQKGLHHIPQRMAAGNPFRVFGSAQGKKEIDDLEKEYDHSGDESLIADQQDMKIITKDSLSVEQYTEQETTSYSFDLSIDGMSPNIASGGTGSEVVVSGSGFGERGSNDHLAFYYSTYGGQHRFMSSDIVFWTNSEIVAVAPMKRIDNYLFSASSGPVHVYLDGTWSPPIAFTASFGYFQRKWGGSDPTVPYRVNYNSNPVKLSAVKAAADTWSEVGANFTFDYDGPTNATSIGHNNVNEIIWATLPEGILGRATIYSRLGEIIEADIVFNSDIDWSPGEEWWSFADFDVETVAVHELGHWLGLTDLYGSFTNFPNDLGKVMYGRIASGEIRRNLHEHDILGIKWIYGTSSSSRETFEIGVSANPNEGGSVSGGGSYTAGENVTVKAVASEGYRFVNWTDQEDSVVSDEEEYTVKLEDDINLTANFELKKYSIEVSVTPEDGGEVNGGGTYEHGEKVTLKAEAAEGFKFETWEDNDTSENYSDVEYVFTAESDRNLVAIFKEIEDEPDDSDENGDSEEADEPDDSDEKGETDEPDDSDEKGETDESDETGKDDDKEESSPSPSPEPDPEPEPPGKTVLTSPVDDAFIAGGAVDFSWEAADKAESYLLQIRDAEERLIFKEKELGNVTSAAVEGFSDDGSEYIWRVRAVNSDGRGDWSDYETFINGEVLVFDYGDLHNTGSVDVQDVVLLMRYVLGLEQLDEIQLLSSDVNGDGSVDVRDVNMIMQKALGLMNSFPAENQ